MTWSADVVADDWKHINASEVVRRTIARLDEKGKGILLLHDIQPATALALPELLRQLKAKGYRIVLVVPGKGELSCRLPQGRAPATAAAQPGGGRRRSVATSVRSAGCRIGPPRVATPAAALPSAGTRRVREAGCRGRQARDVGFGRRQSARGDDIPRDPVRPFTSGSKPARNMPTPGKFITTEPGGWPPVISVPVPSSGWRRRIVGGAPGSNRGRALPVALNYFNSTVSGL